MNIGQTVEIHTNNAT